MGGQRYGWFCKTGRKSESSSASREYIFRLADAFTSICHLLLSSAYFSVCHYTEQINQVAKLRTHIWSNPIDFRFLPGKTSISETWKVNFWSTTFSDGNTSEFSRNRKNHSAPMRSACQEQTPSLQWSGITGDQRNCWLSCSKSLEGRQTRKAEISAPHSLTQEGTAPEGKLSPGSETKERIIPNPAKTWTQWLRGETAAVSEQMQEAK